MLKILGILAAIAALLTVAVLVYAATLPDVFRVQRTTAIKAPPEKIYPLINDLHGFTTWSPYEKMDPGMKKTFGGPSSGPGASYEWDGNKNIGKGRLEIAQSSPFSKVTMNLDFERPFEAHNIVDFTLEPRGDTTNVTWVMQGKTPYFAKIVHVFMNMDKMVGGQFEEGLANLKALAEQ